MDRRTRIVAMALLLSGGVSEAQTREGATFEGALDFIGSCPSERAANEGAPVIAGRLYPNFVALRLPRGHRTRANIATDGSFKVSAQLRPDPLGVKMQYHEGRISGGQVRIRSTFIVPGHPATQCTAQGVFNLR